jgi:preprotein translocase subunit SecA
MKAGATTIGCDEFTNNKLFGAAFYVSITFVDHTTCMLNSVSLVNPKVASPVRAKRATDSAPNTKAPTDAFAASVPTDKQNFLSRLVSKALHGSRWTELQDIERLDNWAQELSTPQQFRAQTERLKQRLASGESLDDIRVEAYTVAARATQVSTGMKPYDSQVLGALALGSNEIAEMMTGEGKTLTAAMPLYLHALAGKGAHLVTVNDTLAQRDAEEMGPAFELLGLSVGTVLEGMTPAEKRAGYGCDVTYTTDRAIGFDYLRDRTVKSLDEKVQREPFYALIDEVDEVLLDEARTPLIISGAGAPASEDYHRFDGIMQDLKPGIDYFVDREAGTAWLSDLGLEYVENELYGQTVSRKDPGSFAQYHRKAGAIRAQGKSQRALLNHQKKKPSLMKQLFPSEWSERLEQLEEQHQKAVARTDAFPDPYELYTHEHEPELRFLGPALKAHALFDEGVDYIVQDQRVKIVDENKGRTSDGRRFNQGLHQALEAKSKVPIRPESRPIASITYPNLFKHYPHLAGMSGTAKTAEAEFQKLYGLSVTEIPTNLQFQLNPSDPSEALRHHRIDQPDAIFSTKTEKFAAVVAEAIDAYQDGTPVLMGTLSVEANQYLHAQLVAQGVNPASIQVLNAEHVRGDKSLENSIIAQAGRSGMITVATNMAGRGVNIKPDFVNYKKLAIQIEGLADQPVVVDVKTEKEANKLAAWLEDRFPYRVGGEAPKQGETLIRVDSEEAVPDGATGLRSEDFPTGGLYVLGTERAKSRRIDDQLIGRSGRQGKVGKSKFFLSLEDDLLRELAKHKLDGSLRMVSGKQVESEFVDGLVSKAQARLSEMDLHAREQVGLYDKTLSRQRETFYAVRDEIVESNGELRDKIVADTQDYVAETLQAELSKLPRHSAADINGMFEKVAAKLQLPLQWTHLRSGKAEEVVEECSRQIAEQLDKAFQEFDRSEVDLNGTYRAALLGTCDDTWSGHLEMMQHLKQGVQWVTSIGEKPEDAYKRRGFERFETTIMQIRDRSVVENVPQILIGAAMLKTEREALAEQALAS